ncbi:MAG: tRNA pseudouridine(38-40) synthase TruA [Opitutae bacterium]|jgi:tRNA pseudouridine38-40 synthase|nr:tRNA pseudouridine(38-40) synthase TruA [Opitutae bacterium]
MKKVVPTVKRWRCLCAYDGTEYAGWQKQPSGGSVQNAIDDALGEIFQSSIKTVGAGRTDAGVHSKGQVFHFDWNWKHGECKLLQALRSKLPNDISPRSIKLVSSSFHALSSARGKCYRYRAVEGWAMPEGERFCISLKNQKIDVDAMRSAAKCFVGKHDFSAFAASRGKGVKEDPVKEVWKFDIQKKRKELQFIVEGSGFLYKMVRSMVGGLFEVGRGKIEVQLIKELLKSRKRTEVVVSAPAKGLCLEKVYYRMPKGKDE